MEELLEIQSELKAPKGQFNNFGKYKYRSCEDILEAVKPLLKEHGVLMTMTDELVNIGERYYVKATITLSKDGATVSSSAYAREPENKKGMDEAQVTGTASSYARKYCANGLFLIDDTKDSDTGKHPDNKTAAKKEPENKSPGEPPTTSNFKFLKAMNDLKDRITKVDGNHDMYYKKLGNAGFEKSKYIVAKPDQEKVYGILKAYVEEQEKAANK